VEELPLYRGKEELSEGEGHSHQTTEH
jgi:hypothetical protein